MAIVWTNKPQLDREFRALQDIYDIKAIRELMKVGEECVRRAREEGNYTDRTANLRNSIGYIVIHDERIMFDSFNGSATGPETQPGDRELAHQRGLEYAKRVGDELKGYKTYLVLVAGMEYAAYVEARGRDVIQSTADWVEARRTELMDEFRRYLISDKI